MQYTFHVVGLPHTQTTDRFSSCAYTDKIRKFCTMMSKRGHNIILYAGEYNSALVAEHVPCISETHRAAALDGQHYTQFTADPAHPLWKRFLKNAVGEIHKRIEPRDFILLFFGDTQRSVADAFPNHIVVEPGIGYGGSFAKYRIFESYAWMHTCYGAQAGSSDRNGNWFDAVVPGFFDPDRFKLEEVKDSYLLFLGRPIERKGILTAVQVAKATGRRLLVAGPGDAPEGCEYLGEVGPDERCALLGKAHALLAPTTYIEPFGNVVVEAQACGTPTITTDWGAFTETNPHGVTGYRCRTLKEFVYAVDHASDLNRHTIRDRAMEMYSAPNVALQFERQFDRLYSLWGEGWGAL